MSNGDKRVQACLHACEGLATVDLASNEKGWLTDVVFKAAAVENDLEHYRRIVRRQDHGEAYDTLRRVNLDLSAQIAKLEAHQSANTALPEGYKLLKDSTFDGRSWKEDVPLENGGYYCTCCVCERQFMGHKRRVLCKVCDAEKRSPYVSQSTPK